MAKATSTSLVPTRQQPNNLDYISIIKENTTALSQAISPVWIKGHQSSSSTAEGSSLSDIQHNNHADKLATWYRDHSKKPQSKEQTDHVPGTAISVYINKIRLVSHIESSIRYHTYGYHLCLYTQLKHEWTDRTWNTIDFESFGMFHKWLSASYQVSHTKFLFDQQATGNNRFKRARVKEEALHYCPCCRLPFESTNHILQCSSTNPAQHTSLSTLKKALQSPDNHPTITLLGAGICHWIQPPEIPFTPDLAGFPTKFYNTITKALVEQQTIGWAHKAMRGYLSLEWRKIPSGGRDIQL